MGFYDGVCGKASSHAVSLDVDCPVVLVVDCKGMSTSIGAVISGFLNFRTPNNIVGFIFNRLPPQLVDEIKALCNEAGTEFLGYFPNSPECALESRKLGLVTPEGVCELKQKTQLLAGKAEQHINISRMLELSESRQLTDLAEMPAKTLSWRQDCGCTRRCFLIYIPRQYTISGASRCRNYIFFPN